MILVVTNERDLTSDYIVLELQNRGLPFIRFNSEQIVNGHVVFHPKLGKRAWELIIEGSKIDLLKVRAGYFRRPGKPRAPMSIDSRGIRNYCEAEWAVVLSSMFNSIEHLWLNSPSAIQAAENKPLQLSTAHAMGFSIPETVITNRQADVRMFLKNGCSVGKPLRHALIEQESSESVIFTTRLSAADASNEKGINLAPIILQREIKKSLDIRVTVIGGSVFSAEIQSQDFEQAITDWRREMSLDLVHREHDLPFDLAEMCVSLTRKFGLRFSAIDLVLDNLGQYWFLEMNPNGQWAWIENRTGLPITSAIVDELERIGAWR